MGFFRRDNGLREEVIAWLEKYDRGEHTGRFLFAFDYYSARIDMMSTDELVARKKSVEAKIAQYNYEKSLPPKPKIGHSCQVYIYGHSVQTLYNITSISKNSSGTYFTETKEDGTIKLHSFKGEGISWTED